MAGTRRNKKQLISDEIQKIEEKITSLEEKIRSLEEKRESLTNELSVIEEAEAKAAEEAKTKEIINLIHKKGLTLDEVKELLEREHK